MSWIDNRLIRQLRNQAKALNNHKHRTTVQIRSANGETEECIARERHVFLFTIKEHAALRMPRCLYHLELMFAKLNDIITM